MHGDPLLHPSALDSLRGQLFPLATLVTPNLDEVRLLVDIEVIDEASQRDAARALHALGPQWALVKGGHLRSSPQSPDLLFDGTDFYEFDAPRVDTGDDHGAGDTLAAAAASALAHGYTVPDAVAFGKRWVTECLRAAYPLGHGHGPVSALFQIEQHEPRCDRGHRPSAGGRPGRCGRADPRRRWQPGIAAAEEDLRRVGPPRLAGGALQPALPAAPAERSAFGIGGQRS